MFGWGSKKPEEPEGYLGELSENQQAVFAEFKNWIVSQGYDQNPWFNDTFYLRYCRARKFDIKKMVEMFTNYMNFRKENGIDTIL